MQYFSVESENRFYTLFMVISNRLYEIYQIASGPKALQGRVAAVRLRSATDDLTLIAIIYIYIHMYM